MCLLDGLFLHAVLGLPALGNSWEVVKQLYTATVIAWAVGVLEATQMAERATGQAQEEPATLQQCPRLPVDRETKWLVQERDFFNHHLKQIGDIGKWDQAIKVTFQPAVYCLVFTLTNQTVLKVDITTTTPPHLRQAREVVYGTLCLGCFRVNLLVCDWGRFWEVCLSPIHNTIRSALTLTICRVLVMKAFLMLNSVASRLNFLGFASTMRGPKS